MKATKTYELAEKIEANCFRLDSDLKEHCKNNSESFRLGYSRIKSHDMYNKYSINNVNVKVITGVNRENGVPSFPLIEMTGEPDNIETLLKILGKITKVRLLELDRVI